MNEPTWLTKEVMLAVQEELLSRFGGPAGVREESLLDSALGRPKQWFQYETPNLFQLAASYAHGIISNHPFADGNKRAGFMAAYIFLGINGKELIASEEHTVLETMALAAGTSSLSDYAEWLERSSTNSG